MSRSAEYRAGYINRLKTHLALPWYEDGEPVEELWAYAKMLQRELGSQIGFVGISPDLGSILKGYATTETNKDTGHADSPSDIDMAIFYDSSLQPGIAAKIESIIPGALRFHAREIRGMTHPTHFPPPFRHDLNMNTIRDVLVRPKPGLKTVRVVESLVSLAGIAAGPSIDEYRAMIATAIGDMPEQQQKHLLDALVNRAISREQTPSPADPERSKMMVRMLDGIPQAEIDEMIEARKKLHRARFGRLYGFTA